MKNCAQREEEEALINKASSNQATNPSARIILLNLDGRRAEKRAQGACLLWRSGWHTFLLLFSMYMVYIVGRCTEHNPFEADIEKGMHVFV
jgi:hypothetical protein